MPTVICKRRKARAAVLNRASETQKPHHGFLLDRVRSLQTGNGMEPPTCCAVPQPGDVGRSAAFSGIFKRCFVSLLMRDLKKKLLLLCPPSIMQNNYTLRNALGRPAASDIRSAPVSFSSQDFRLFSASLPISRPTRAMWEQNFPVFSS